MKTKSKSENQLKMQFKPWAFTGCVAWMLLLPLGASGAGVVTDCTESNLRAAMTGGGTVTFACEGTITLASTITNSIDTVLDASGHQITISGSSAVRVFYVNTNVTFALANLTIANGRASSGAGVFNAGGTVNITNCTFTGNSAQGAAGTETSTSGTPGQDGCGGALDNFGVLNLIDCTFNGNSAIGGGGGNGQSVYLPGASPYPGGNGGIGFGGAVLNSGSLTASGCTFSGNSAAGGVGGSGGSFLSTSTSPIAGAGGGSGGRGNGGALYNGGVAHLVNCTLGFNTGAGAAGGAGGHGSYPPTPDYAPGAGGADGLPGRAFGGICDDSGQCHLTNCTLAFNSCTSSSYGPGTYSIGGTITSGSMVNTLLVNNIPGGNGTPAITDLGHNLSSDDTCAFTHAGSLNGAYVLLGPLTNNGGLTATMALLPSTLAIDGGDSAAAPPTDQRGIPRPFGNAADIGAYEYNSPTNPPPTQVVSSCTEASLRAAMAPGGTVTFSCDGTIPLAGTIIIPVNTVLDATGHQITISGDSSVGVLHVNTNVSFTAINLTIANGRGGSGSGIFNDGGMLTLLSVSLRSNVAREVSGLLPQGGAIFNRAGSVNATNCTFAGNRAVSTNNYSPPAARGGAIRNESGEVNLQGCIFTTNQVSGTMGGTGGTWQSGAPGGSGWGGALDNSANLTVSSCSFIGNSAVGAKGGGGGQSFGPGIAPGGGPGGTGAGGAVCNFGAITIGRSTFSGNSVTGGAGGSGGFGALAEPGGGGGGGGAGGSGNGGAIFNAGAAQLINCTMVFNSGAGGSGGGGGNGGQARMVRQGGNGGNGGAGGSGFGAICDTNGLCWITNCTLALNAGTNGIGGTGGYGGYGYIPGTPGVAGPAGAAGGGIRTAGTTLVNTLLATNDPGGNCFGIVADAGHNLSSDASCAFTKVGSLNNTDPKLGPLADNGGPTLTMALLPGSPAIDGGDDFAAPSNDQRGLPRPVGAAADMGSFEYGSPALLHINYLPGNAVGLSVVGVKNQSCRLFTSSTLMDWQCVATNQIGPDGTVLFQDNCGIGETQRFYKVALP